MNLITGLTRIGPSSFFVSTRSSFQKLALIMTFPAIMSAEFAIKSIYSCLQNRYWHDS